MLLIFIRILTNKLFFLNGTYNFNFRYLFSRDIERLPKKTQLWQKRF